MTGARHSTVSHAESGHTILYLAGEDTAADRHNIALLERLVPRSTNRIHAEILYQRPLQLSSFASESGHLRYVRLRSDSEFVLAERIVAARTDSVLYFSFRTFAHADDLWQLLAYSARTPYTLALPDSALRNRNESSWSFALRSARLHLARYTGSPDESAMVAMNKMLLQQQTARRASGLLLRKFYADLIHTIEAPRPLLLKGRSRQIEARKPLWLKTLRHTLMAYRIWRDSRQFPWWFSYRHPLFVVAQMGFYAFLLLLPLSPRQSLILLAFSLSLSLPYFLRNMLSDIVSTLHRPRDACLVIFKLAARFLLYLIG
jgi:hypothetical protein